MTAPHPEPRSARRMADIEPFHVMEVLGRAKALEAQGRSIVHMEVGEPDFPTPRPVVEAGLRAVERGDIHYTPALGIPELREAISGWYLKRYGIRVPASRIAVTTGSSGALLLAAGVLLDPGDKVLMADPGYPCNRHFVRFTEGEPVAIPVTPATRYQLAAAHVEKHWEPRTRAALVATPSNPTGTLISSDEMREIAAAVEGRGGTLIVDEIYHGLTYGTDARTVLEITDRAFVVNSFSKYFGMTGWRLGWLVVPEPFVRDVEKLAQNLFISPPTPSQRAALAAFSPENLVILEARREEFRRRRDYLLPALRELGFGIPVTPEGAFYLYADCARFSDDAQAFCLRVLEEVGVAITPGLDFGRHEAWRHVRFAYTTSLDGLEAAVARLRRFLHD